MMVEREDALDIPVGASLDGPVWGLEHLKTRLSRHLLERQRCRFERASHQEEEGAGHEKTNRQSVGEWHGSKAWRGQRRKKLTGGRGDLCGEVRSQRGGWRGGQHGTYTTDCLGGRNESLLMRTRGKSVAQLDESKSKRKRIRAFDPDKRRAVAVGGKTRR